ncbi:MAG TPA: hypothetical protein VH969_18560 [Actinophytocola sp.]|jgi:hypothetical protein|uniref:hypothetical protein n=1 Tax=Actinophytocola sp. TaxID=1872138 RepID=UPI002F94CA75
MLTADDLDLAVRLSLSRLAVAAGADWDVPAGPLTWTCWETAEHLADDLFFYATQLSPPEPPADDHVPFAAARRRPDGPLNSVAADRAAGVPGLLRVVAACAGLLSATVRVRPPWVRAYHVFGRSDPAGFAAMGTVETVVHTHDIAAGLGLSWTPPQDVCDRVLTRLFPDAPAGFDRWQTMLWCTGRASLPGRERRTSWRWDGTPG